MMTISINVEPYLAHYMYARYANCIHEGAIKLSHRANLYHILLELTAPRPQGISWHDTGNLILALRHRQRSTHLQLPKRRKHPPARSEDKPPNETRNDRIHAQRKV